MNSGQQGTGQMSSDKALRLAPALVSGAGSHRILSAGLPVGAEAPGRPAALALTPVFNRGNSSAPPRLPPFVIRLPSPPGPVMYVHYPLTD